jgi:hypothetical protein
VQQKHVTRTAPLSTYRSRRRRSVLIHWKLEKLALGHPSQCPGNPRIQKPNDGLKHPIRSGGIAPMNPKYPPPKTEHHRSIGVGHDPIDVSESKPAEPIRQAILE